MSLAVHLIEQAELLATKEPRRPRQASLRRAISSAYYGVFHHLIDEAVRFVVGTSRRRADLRTTLRRSFEHGLMRRTASDFAGGSPQGPWGRVGGPVPGELRSVAGIFEDLQVLRHRADYDLATRFTRQQANSAIHKARRAVEMWSEVRGSRAAEAFLLGLLARSRA